jgi:class 3 adenylate cyclase
MGVEKKTTRKQSLGGKIFNVRNRQVLFVCFAFILMILISFFATTIILYKHLKSQAEELLLTVELNIASNLREAITTTVGSALTIEYLVNQNESQESIHHYMIEICDWLLENKNIVYGLGLYGFIRGEFLDGTHWEPPPDYVPQERPWYIAAKEKAGEYAETIPYLDAHTGEIVISYSKELFNHLGESIGVLALDVVLNQLGEYVENIRQSESGYGILTNQNFEIIAHPIIELKGEQLSSINNDFIKVQTILASGKPISALRVINYKNIAHIAFFKQIYNGWYIGSMTPVNAFFKEMYFMAFILTLVGIALMLALSIIILRQHRSIDNYTDTVLQLNEASRRFVPTQFVKKIIGVDNIAKLKLGDSVQGVITVMFFDIRFFAVHSQMLSINQTFDLVNNIFGLAGSIIQKHNGFVDKYLGDAAMVLFERAGDALRAGIEIYNALILDKSTRITQGLDGIDIGIGAHTGNVMMGVIGDTEHYASTVISKHVNITSRIEGLTKLVKAGMLISADMMVEIPVSERNFNSRYLGLINPALSRETVGIFEVLDVLPDNIKKLRLKTLKVFESGVRNFHTENYKLSAERFKKVMDFDPTDECAKLFYNEVMARVEGRDRRSVFIFNTK